MGIPITRDQLLQLRLTNQLLAPEGEHDDAARPADVVHHLLAMQAQDFGQALWGVGLRSRGSNRGDVLAALESGAIVRSWPMRGTLHFVRPEDLRWMLALTTERLLASSAKRHRELELDQATFHRARDVAVEVLSGGRRLSRNGFLAELNRAGISTSAQRGYHLIWYLAQVGIVCWGPPDGNQQALVLLDEWAPEGARLEREEALQEFVLRYFKGHGPATLRDFVWWSKLTVADAKIGLELARGELTEFIYDGESYWAASTPDAPGEPPTSSHVLPGFDEYVIGYQDRAPVLAAEFAERIVPGKNGVFRPALVQGGRVVGTWRKSADGSTVLAEPFRELPVDESLFASSVTAYERFSG